MRNVLKAETLERKFPLLSVENGCIVSKDADLTVAFEVELPELYTVTADEYEAMHASWIKAIKVLPEHSVVCKQDWFVKGDLPPENRRGGTELPCTQLRAALQRKALPEPQMLPVPDEDHP